MARAGSLSVYLCPKMRGTRFPPVCITPVRLCQGRLLLGIAAPFKPFASSSGISGILSHLLTRAEIHGVPSGSHIFGHSLATSLLRNGTGLQAIGTILRHQSPGTTAIHAKVDVPMLQRIAQPCPGEAAC